MARGGKRQRAGRTKTAIVMAVRFDIVCPHCEKAFLKDVTAVKGQNLICSECGQTSVIPTSTKINTSENEHPTLILSSFKKGLSSLGLDIDSVSESLETIKEPVIEKMEQSNLIGNQLVMF